MSHKYRKKPVVVEAYQWNHRYENYEGAPKWLKDAHQLSEESQGAFFVRIGAEDGTVITPHGPVAVQPGDWLIKGPQGDLYPCKAYIFEQTYEKVED